MYENSVAAWLLHFVRPSNKIKQGVSPKEGNKMNIGDKIIAVGTGRKTKELNGGDLNRPARKVAGFAGLVSDMVVMTITELNDDRVITPFYRFHKDDVHLVDVGRASAPLAPVITPEPETVSLDGEYTAEQLSELLDSLS